MKTLLATSKEQVSVFREIRQQWRRQLVKGNFYAEGEQVVSRLLRSKLNIHSLLVTPEYFEQWKELIASRKDREVTVWLAQKKWMEENTGQKLNQPCLAIGKLPPSPFIKDLISTPCCFVALDGIDHAVNVGSILRNCAAFGVTAVIVDKTTIHPYSWRAVRASLGGVFQVPVCLTDSLCETLSVLRVCEIDLYAADPDGSVPIAQTEFSRNRCLIFGNEHKGLSESVLSLAPKRVAIPLSGSVDSLNVAAATAVFLFNVRRTK